MTRVQQSNESHLDTPQHHASRQALRRWQADAEPSLVAHGLPVPIAVWDVADAAQRSCCRRQADAFTPRLAALLVGAATRPSDLIVAIGELPALAGAAGAGGRLYRAVADPQRLASLQYLSGAAALAVLPWPLADAPSPRGPNDLAATFHACRRVLRRGGDLVVAIPSSDMHTLHMIDVVPAALSTGLTLQQRIVAVTAPVTGRRRPWTATPAHPAARRAAAHVSVHIELLTFGVSRRSG